MTTQRFALALLLIFALLPPGAIPNQRVQAQAGAEPPRPARSMLFVENADQWPAAARFQVWGSPLGIGTTWLAEEAIWLVVSRQVDNEERARCDAPLVPLATCQPVYSFHALKLTFPGSSRDVRIEPFDPLTTTVNYLIGNDPAQWRAAVPVWGGVRYVDLYRGVDLEISSANGKWSWRFQSRSGGDLNDIQLQIDGGNGLSMIDDNVRVFTDSGLFDLQLPTSPISHQSTIVQGTSGVRYQKASDRVEELVERSHRHSEGDPSQLVYGTYLGGGLGSEGYAVAVDDQGQVTLTGRTHAWDFPTTPGAFNVTFAAGACGVPPNTYPCPDAFVSQLSSDGSTLLFSTFLGGSNADVGNVVALTAQGQVIAAGLTLSGDFPATAGALDVTCGTDANCNDNGTDRYSDGFIALLSSNGSVLGYSTYLGDSRSDGIRGGHVDTAGRFWVAGFTESPGFPTTAGAFDRQFNGATDGFVARLSADGRALEYGSFIGGSDSDSAYAVDLDRAGRVYIAGQTSSDDFPVPPGAFDHQLNGATDAFVMRLNSAGSTMEYAIYLGGSSDEIARGLAVDALDRVYVGGNTNSIDMPVTPGAYQPGFGGGTCGQSTPCYDAFMARLGSDGSSFQYATFLGGSNNDYLRSVVIDSANRVYISGDTYSANFPVTPDAFDTNFDGHASDCYVSRLNETGNSLEYSTFIGGFTHDWGSPMARDGSGNVYLTGQTQGSSDFPTTPGAFDPYTSGRRDLAFVVKLRIGPYAPSILAPIEQPNAGAFVVGAVALRGFAIDLSSATGTGIDAVHIYLDGPYGTGTIVGGAAYGLDRPDIAAQYGARFGPSGWELAWNTAGLAPGVHRLYLYAHRTTDNAWSLMDPHLVVVAGGPARWLPIMLRQR
jgi:hypothetical protein